jgi:hypothetical protein
VKFVDLAVPDSGTAIDQSFLRRCRFVLDFPASGERTPQEDPQSSTAKTGSHPIKHRG